MDRINGFLNINSYLDEIKKRENLDDLDLYSKGYIRKSFAHKTHSWIKINGGEYYFKETDHPYAEVLAYEVAKFLNINATPYDLATFNGITGTISKSYRKEGCKYISGTKILNEFLNEEGNLEYLESMGFDKNRIAHLYNDIHIAKEISNLEIIWSSISERYKKKNIKVDMSAIMRSLVEQFIFNILVLQNDGFPQNWELEESKDGVKVVPIFDNELCFIICQFDIYPRNLLSTNFDDAGKNNYDILKEFLSISSSEYVELFLEKFNILTEEIFVKLIENVEEKIGCNLSDDVKTTYINNFVFNRQQINQVLRELHLNESR